MHVNFYNYGFQNLKLFISTVILFFTIISTGQMTDPRLIDISTNFVRNTPTDWSLQQGAWQYFDVKECFLRGETCYGNNPTSPYGFPHFGEINGVGYFKMNPSEAVVIFMRTPPQVRYFGFTQYLYQRFGQTNPAFGSMSDTLNHLSIKTIDSNQSGVFDNYAVLVWTADRNTFRLVQSQLANQGIPSAAVNFIEAPLQLPLFMGYGQEADSFNMLMRMALPTVQQNLDLYIQENPFAVYKVGPPHSEAIDPGHAVPYKEEDTGIFEGGTRANFQALNSSLGQLKTLVKSNYEVANTLMEQPVKYSVDKGGWDCIAGTAVCNGDNHDALYSIDAPIPFQLRADRDFVMIVGVNHKKTGKAIYVNHTIYDLETVAGISSIADPLFTTASALYHAGITNPTRKDVQKYANFYAYAISYNCGSMKFCLQIPAPTEANPIGLEPGTPFFLLGRKYVDIVSGVRPSENEIVKHAVFVFKQK